MNINCNPLHYPYPSQRMVTYGRKGMVATSQHLAAQAGLDIMKRGGNAVDAAIAAAACLTVVEPCSNGIGGDNFALVWFKEKLHGLNSSGPSPRSISIEAVKKRGHREMPRFGWIPVTVPGAPAGWVELNKRFGNLSLMETLQPAIDYAENGFPLSPQAGAGWKRAHRIYSDHLKEEQFNSWFETFAPGRIPPDIGDMVQLPDHGKTLRDIGESNGESFYRGEISEKIDAYSRKYKGFLRREDLENYKPRWVDPINVNYKGFDVWEIPPNGQGLVALIALNILNNDDFSTLDKTEIIHRQIEAVKLAFADGKARITDPDHLKESVKALLSDAYGRIRRSLMGESAGTPDPGTPPQGGTVYLATADGDGNMVSFIQSNYMGFGSGLVVPGTGISLQNRGHGFSLDPAHANCLKPAKRTYHTIIPGFLTKDGKAVGPFGVMGGFMQPQGHVQVIMNTVDFHLNPQSALDAPRWQWMEGRKVLVEHGISPDTVRELKRRGHEIQYDYNMGTFGRGQIIWRDEKGILSGGTEPRTDGAVVTW